MLPAATGTIQPYECETDGIPNAVIEAGQGSQPAIEFFLPLFSSCSDALSRVPAHLPPGMCIASDYFNIYCMI